MISVLAGLGLGLSLIVAIGAQNVFVLRQGLRRDHVLVVVVLCAASDAVLIVAGVAGLGALLTAAPWLENAARVAGAPFLLGYALLAARRAWRGEETGLRVEEAGVGTDESGLRGDEAGAGSAEAVLRVDEAGVGGDGTGVQGAGQAGDSAAPASPTAPAAVRRTMPRPSRATGAPGSTRLSAVVLTTLALTWLNPHVYLDTVLMLGSIAATHGDDRWLFAGGAVLGSILWFTGLGFGARHFGRWLRTPRSWRVLDGIIAAIMLVLAVGLALPVLGA
ncbi:LysE/ArgO family amino acid transporter [Microbacterium sp. MC2]